MIKIGTNNIRNFPDIPRDHVARAAEIGAQRADIQGFQEIGDAGGDMEDVRRGCGPRWDFSSPETNNPIGWNKSRIQIPDRSMLKGHRVSGASVAYEARPKMSPTRHVTWQAFLAPGPRLPFYVVNSHMMVAAFKENPNLAGLEARKEAWYEGYVNIGDRILRLNDSGFTVVFVCDTNYHGSDMVPWDKDWKWVHNKGIDKIGVLEGNMKVSVVDFAEYDTPSDHNVHVASLDFKKAS